MDELLQNYFSLDSIGIKENINPLRSKEDECAKKIMESTTKYIPEEKIFEAGLLWKYERIHLPDSFPMARRRLFCLESKMNKDPQLKSFIVEKIKDYEQKGYVRKLRPNEISSGGRSWYIPIFTVKNKNKTKKKNRIVWDAAAAVENVSLNSVLLKGPDLLKSLVGVLLRFRERPIALSGDIREMFHQLRIEKVLGMWWIPLTDELTFVGKFGPEAFDENIVPTKRSVLRIIMTFFVPLGLLGHFVIYAKIILHKIWISRVDWEEPVFDQERE